MQRSDVTVTEQNLWVRLYDPIIEQRQQPRRSVATPKANNRIDLTIAEHPHQVPCPFAVGPCQKPEAFPHVRSQLHLKAKALQPFDSSVDRFRIRRWAGRGDNPNGIAVIQPWRFDRQT
jgi:hypothetical protein